MSTPTLARRLDAFGPAVPPTQAAKAQALQTLHDASFAACGGRVQREAWFQRAAAGRCTEADDFVLAALPLDALAAVGLESPMAYALATAALHADF